MIKMRVGSIALLTGLLGSVSAFAADTWTSTTGVLNAPIVKYSDNRYYSNVTAVVGSTTSSGTTGSPPNLDSTTSLRRASAEMSLLVTCEAYGRTEGSDRNALGCYRGFIRGSSGVRVVSPDIIGCSRSRHVQGMSGILSNLSKLRT